MNKPKIRFNEFGNIWTKSKLGELYEIYSGNTPSRSDNRNYQNGEIPWIKTTDLNNSIILSNEEKISIYGATKLKVLPEKSVLIAMYGGFNQIGRTGLLAYPATINQALAALMPINEIYPNFLLNFLNFKKESWRNVAASSRKDPNITKNDVEKFIISFPSLEEQSAIGSLFHTLDDLLASYKDNLANYQSLKATMLSKMFPKAGQTVPEIRLDGFEGGWEVKELGDVVKFYSGLTYKPSDVLSCGTLVLRSSNVRDGELIYIDNVFVNPDIVNCQNVKSGDIVVVVRNGSRDLIGKHALIRSEMPKTVIGAFMTGVRCDNPEFINALLDTKMFISEIHRNLGSTINQITTGNFKRMKFYFPLKDEQQAIGAYFSNLDNLIAAHQEKISQLETLKKKLLQDMFM
ncbi:restriction endonuclease subunit S [Streptococcus australis]|uniref:restriction endonuclease subunit S n=1 Tax=Streptococcus australis TaxID=113107 RepID=UPI0039C0D27B